MNLLKDWLNSFATINIIIVIIYWLNDISRGASIFFILSVRWYIFIMVISSLLAYLRHLEVATVLQIFGCFQYGFVTLLQTGIGMAFSQTTFWEAVLNNPIIYITFLGFCIIAAGLLILEYIEVRRYNPKKYHNTIS